MLNQAQLQGANMWSVNLASTRLHSVNFFHANLKWANLQWADLRFINLDSANLSEAFLSRADLSFSRLNNIYAFALPKGNVLWDTLEKAESLFMARISEHEFLERIYPKWRSSHPRFKDIDANEEIIPDIVHAFENDTRMAIVNENIVN